MPRLSHHSLPVRVELLLQLMSLRCCIINTRSAQTVLRLPPGGAHSMGLDTLVVTCAHHHSVMRAPRRSDVCSPSQCHAGSPAALVGRTCLPAQETGGRIPGWGRSPAGGHGNPLQYPRLENPLGGSSPWGRKESDTAEHLHTRGLSLRSAYSPLSASLEPLSFLYVCVGLSFPEYDTVGFIHCVSFSGWLLSLSNKRLLFWSLFVAQRLTTFKHCVIFHCTGYGQTVVYLSTHWLKGIFVASKFCQLWKKLI